MSIVLPPVGSTNTSLPRIRHPQLTQTEPTAQTLISSSLLPTAFHSLTYSAQSDRIISFGGMTSSCSSDSIIHSLNLGSNSTSPNELIWEREKTEGLLRRRGAGIVFLDSTVGDVEGGKMMVFGGLVDEYVCCKSKDSLHKTHPSGMKNAV